MPRGQRFKNLTGKRYTRCTVLGFAGYKGPYAAWLCRCRCGILFVRAGYDLQRGRDRCGCGRNKSPIAKPIREMWYSMIGRCYDPRHVSYHRYGKQGVRVCKRWRDSVEAFARDMGKRPSVKHIVVRKNKRGHFSPANCRWGLHKDVPAGWAPRLITHDAKTLSLAGWAREVGIRANAMRLRANKGLGKGWDMSLAVTLPVRTWRSGWPR